MGHPDKDVKRRRIKILRRSNRVIQIHDQLRGLILEGSFGPGMQLSQLRLCRELGVGRTPMREALRMLQQEGLIIAEPNKRPRVVSFDAEVIDANFAQIILVSSLAAAVSIPSLTAEDLSEMQTALAQMQAAGARGDVERWNQADYAFHSRIYVHAGAALGRFLTRIWDENHYYLRFLMTSENVPWSKINDEHEEILAACTARDIELAPKLIARHIAGGSIALLAHAMPEREPRLVRAAMRLIVQRPELVTRRRAVSA